MSRRPGTLIVRADANQQIGAGHVMRCLALAEAWQDHGGEVVFVGDIVANLRDRLSENGIKTIAVSAIYPDPADFESVRTVVEWIAASPESIWIVVDGYRFDVGYLSLLKALKVSLLVIDDTVSLPFYPADIVLNQGAGAADLNYPPAVGTKFLLGEHYRMIRREFRMLGTVDREPPRRSERLMIAMGGADSRNVTGQLLAAFAKSACSDMAIDVVVGPANRYVNELRDMVASLDMSETRLLLQPYMPEVMCRADMAISAGGSTLCELAFMGVPCLAITVASNQEREVDSLDARGVVRSLGAWEELDATTVVSACVQLISDSRTRGQMIQAGRRIVDGCGADRVVESMLGVANGTP